MRHRQGSGHHLFQEDSYEVYKIGETQATTIFSTQPTSSRSLLSLTASTRSRWVPTTRSAVLISSWALWRWPHRCRCCFSVVDELNWSRGYIKDYKGGSLVLTQEDKTSTFADYIASGAKFFDVTMTIWLMVLTPPPEPALLRTSLRPLPPVIALLSVTRMALLLTSTLSRP